MDLSLDDVISNTRTKRGGGGQRGGGRGGRSMARGRAGFGISATRRVPEGRWRHDGFTGMSGRGGGGNSRLGLARPNESAKILIENLDFGVTDEDIKELFGEFGPFIKASLHYDRDGRPLGTAEVTYARRQSAIAAKKQFHGMSLDGRPMEISLVGDAAAADFPAPRRSLPGSGGVGGARRGTGARGARRGRGGGRGGAARGPSKTAEELDKELDAYLNKSA